jgi:hypothetical protein
VCSRHVMLLRRHAQLLSAAEQKQSSWKTDPALM